MKPPSTGPPVISLSEPKSGVNNIHVVRDKYQAADVLSKLRSSRAEVPHGLFVQDLVKPSVQEEENGVSKKALDQWLVALATQQTLPAMPSEDWWEPFIRYMANGTGYSDKIENERLLCHSKDYLLVDGRLMCKNARGNTHEMHLPGWRHQTSWRNTYWHMWQSCSFSNAGQKGFRECFIGHQL